MNGNLLDRPIQLGAYVAGTNPALDSSIRLRPEMTDFLRQDHNTSAALAETLGRLDEIAMRLDAPPLRSARHEAIRIHPAKGAGPAPHAVCD